MSRETKTLLRVETEQLAKLRDTAQQAIEGEKLIVDGLLNPLEEILTRGQRISDKVARFGVSWVFISSFF